jgi:hypothetical protein
MRPIHEYIDGLNLVLPNAWVLSRFVRIHDSDFLSVAIALPQENYGFSREKNIQIA